MTKAWDAAHPETIRASRRRYHLAHAAESNEWNRHHPEAARARVKAWKAANPDRVRDINALRRARRAGATVERVVRAVVFQRDQGMCGECNRPVDPLDWHLDHVVPLIVGGAHSYSNTRVTHPECNLSKGKKESRRG